MPALKFENVATEIIGRSVRSVMFIDDELQEPFNGDGDVKLSSGVYESFKAENSSVDFYKFRDESHWEAHGEFSLSGKDMIIIDWELSKTSPSYSSTLRILKDSISKPSVHFICIYTATEQEEFPDIIYKINSFFSPFNNEVTHVEHDVVVKLLDSEGLGFDEVFDEGIIRNLKELVLHRAKTRAIFKEIKESIEKRTSVDLFKKLQNHIIQRVQEGIYASPIHFFCALGMFLNKELVGHEFANISDEIKNCVEKNYLVANHTIVIITNKKEVKPGNLFSAFAQAIVNDSGNFLTLMGLEMRNLFRESSAFIGKDIDSISELAFFYHKDQAAPPEAFFDFLRELWKSQASSFLYDDNKQLKLFEVLEEYKNIKGIDEHLAAFFKKEGYQQHLGKLNYYYNVLNANRKKNDQIKFGDIFQIQDAEGNATDSYLLCITAHCDCLYSKEKIKNMFYFVNGSKGKLTDALTKGDTGFDSYIKNNNSIEVINWTEKPFTLFINQRFNNIENIIEVTVGEDRKILKYHSTLKENYAQRIANNAFVYPLHVGIFFADTKK